MKKALYRDSILALLCVAILFYISAKLDIINVIHRFGYKHQFYETDMIVNFLLASFLVYTAFSIARFVEMVRFFKVMLKISRHDLLTRIYNRRALVELLEIEFVRNQRYPDGRFSFILFDIDDFKHINDSYGHAIGDLVLKSIGQVLLTSIRKSDLSGRFGGDEFAVILPYTDLTNAVSVAEKIKEKVSQLKFTAGKDNFSINLSIGVTEVTHDSGIDTFEKIIAEADKYLYCAKQKGKNTICSSNSYISKLQDFPS